ncbi:MAG: SDR family oxidoreductase [Rhizobiales bacterium]|nr:SDR family oxidoreductase [Hyphomicrobiales bacterium]
MPSATPNPVSGLRPITLVTGASGGIGAALAEVFADNGHAVALVARRAPQLKALADFIEERGRLRPHVIAIDLGERDAAAQIEDDLRDAGFEPQYLVNNAGFGLYGLAAKLDRERQLAMIDLNARTLTDLSLRFIESLARHKGGILNVGSVASFMPGPEMAVYHATKAYVLSFSEALHRELAPRAIRVTALCPGPVETEFMTSAHVPDGTFPRFLGRSAERVAREGYDGLMRGRRVVVPGSANKAATLLPKLLPRGVMLRLVRAFGHNHEA